MIDKMNECEMFGLNISCFVLTKSIYRQILKKLIAKGDVLLMVSFNGLVFKGGMDVTAALNIF